jgi:hypothetical protein
MNPSSSNNNSSTQKPTFLTKQQREELALARLTYLIYGIWINRIGRLETKRKEEEQRQKQEQEAHYKFISGKIVEEK